VERAQHSRTEESRGEQRRAEENRGEQRRTEESRGEQRRTHLIYCSREHMSILVVSSRAT